MNVYKITNISHFLGKRDFKYNSELEIEYVDAMQKKVLKIKPGNSIYLSVNHLPLSIHKLRIKKLISVEEVSQSELNELAKLSQTNKTKNKENNEKNFENLDDTHRKSVKRKSIKKEDE